jgi:hypothetical protein
VEDRQARADRWIEGAHARIGTVEPEWWLRMVCGQLAHEDSVAPSAGMRRAVRRAEKRFLQRFRARPGTVAIEWLGMLSRRDLPPEPVGWRDRGGPA